MCFHLPTCQDGRHLCTKRPQVRGELATVMDGVEEKEPENLSKRLLQNGRTIRRHCDVLYPLLLILR